MVKIENRNGYMINGKPLRPIEALFVDFLAMQEGFAKTGMHFLQLCGHLLLLYCIMLILVYICWCGVHAMKDSICSAIGKLFGEPSPEDARQARQEQPGGRLDKQAGR